MMPVDQKKPSAKPRRLSRIHRPEHLSVEQWQRELRREFATELPLRVRNLGREPVFSEFAVTNPATERTYRVAIRGDAPGLNYCSCPDYAVNTLGTCKHIEAVLHRLRKRHARELGDDYCPAFAEVYVRYGPTRSVMFSPGSDCPRGLVSLARGFFDAEGTLLAGGYDNFGKFVEKAARIDHALRVYDDALALIAEVRDGKMRRAALNKAFGSGHGGRVWKDLLKVPLYPYQQEGALFAARAGRAIIADDMGLGKTIQAIAAAEILARECGLERALIICPTSLKGQWQQEITKFSQRPAMIVSGLTDARHKAYAQTDGAMFRITNYDVVHRDLEAIRKWSPDLVILDEAQRIKNWQTRTAKSVKQIESRFAFVLTGTPLENRLEELHSIVEFVDRHRLGPLFAFKAAHEVHEADSSKVVGYRDLGRINKTLAPILIRRTKKEVLNQLPPRMDKNFFVPMIDQQWLPHDENKEIVARLVAKWRRYRFLTEADQLRLRIALQYMRMACDSTYLVDHETRYHTKIGELTTLLEETFEDPEAKVVIFSQWLRMNELVEEMLEERNWGHVHLHGGVPGPERQNLTRALREDKSCRVFLSTDAGGVGLNLQAASTVINLDLPWNPAVLEQRIGRAHRLGQQRPVRVVNFISEGTIEQGMLSLLAFKKSMFAGVLDGDADEVFMGERAMDRFMKTVETATAAAPTERPVADEDSEKGGADDAPATEAETEAGPQALTRAAASAPGVDVQALSSLLTRGAELLTALGQSLVHAGTKKPGVRSSPIDALIHSDPTSGKPELRIPLPDAATIQNWMGLLAGVMRAK